MPLAPSPVPTTATQAATVPQVLAELTAEQWALWRHHPVSALLLERYLPDFKQGLERDTLNAWLAGNLKLTGEADARGILHCIEMIVGLSLDQVRVFYGMYSFEEEKRRQDAVKQPPGRSTDRWQFP